MVRWLAGGFIVAHGLVTAMIWTAPVRDDGPFDPAHSWLIGDAHGAALALALVAAAGFVMAGVGVLGHQPWWALCGIVSGALGVVLMGLYFNPWLLAGIAISSAIVVAGAEQVRAA